MEIDDPKPHPNNVPGDFFVEDGCCLTCGVPVAEAPDLFTMTDNAFDDPAPAIVHCWVSRQPANREELGRMLKVLAYQEANCIRYKGNDPQLVKDQEQRDEEERRIKAEWAAKNKTQR